MTTSLFAAQEAVYTRLMSDLSLQALLGDPARIYDMVPPDATFPYVTLGDMTVREFDTKDRTGLEQVHVLHGWSRYRGRKELKSVMQAVFDRLHNADLTVNGADFVSCQFLSCSVGAENDGLTLHGVMRLRIVVQH